MKTLIDIIRYFSIGVGVGLLMFGALFFYNRFVENKSNPFASQMYIEILELYKNNILESIVWTGKFEKLFVPDSIRVSALVNYNNNKIYTLDSPYQKRDSSYPMYLIQRGETIFSIKFREQLEIGIWK